MTPDNQQVVVEAAIAGLLEKIMAMPREKVAEMFDRLFLEVMGDKEPWQCPACDYPWPDDEAE